MKRILLLFMAFCSLFISCQKETTENETNDNSSKIIGVWRETHFWNSSSNDWSPWTFAPGQVHEFMEDKTYNMYQSIEKYNSGVIAKTCTYKFDGEYLVLDGGFKEKIVFSEDGNRLSWENECKCVKYMPAE